MRGALLWGCCLLLLVLPSAAAHGDAPTIHWSGVLAPGESVTFERALHWHRVVGTVEAAPDEDTLRLAVEGPDGIKEIRLDREGRVNTLVRCCLDVVWADHTFRLSNEGGEAVAVHIELALLHEDFAVLADGAEGGTGYPIVLFSAMTATAAWRSRPTDPSDPAVARRYMRLGSASIGAAWGLLIALGLIGMLRFGGGPLLGSLTAFAFMPVSGSVFNSHLLGMVLVFALWTTALFAWSGARRRAGGATPHEVWLSVAIVGGGPLFTLLFALEYAPVPVALGYGLVPTAAFLVGRWFARAPTDTIGNQ